MPDSLSNEDVAQLNEALFAGNKIDAIKLYRDRTGASLKEAKEFVDAVEDRLRLAEPGRFAPPGNGCFLSLLALAAAGGMMWWSVV